MSRIIWSLWIIMFIHFSVIIFHLWTWLKWFKIVFSWLLLFALTISYLVSVLYIILHTSILKYSEVEKKKCFELNNKIIIINNHIYSFFRYFSFVNLIIMIWNSFPPGSAVAMSYPVSVYRIIIRHKCFVCDSLRLPSLSPETPTGQADGIQLANLEISSEL